jgi:hypothetical protein
MPVTCICGYCDCAHGFLGIRFAVPIPELDAMPATVACALSRCTAYDRRQPERTLLYRTVQAHLEETWLALHDAGRPRHGGLDGHAQKNGRRLSQSVPQAKFGGYDSLFCVISCNTQQSRIPFHPSCADRVNRVDPATSA